MDIARLTQALRDGAWQDADRLLAAVTASARAHPSMLYNHGKVLMELGRMEQAAGMLRRTVQALPGHAAAWFELGRATLAREDFETAFEAFSRALELEPGDSDARRNLGRVALRLGRYSQARAAWGGLRGDDEAALALYRIAAETGDPSAARLRHDLLAHHPDRAQAIRTLVRVARGAIPLDL
jgi:tetratricopeptide (TPR) repeat protein